MTCIVGVFTISWYFKKPLVLLSDNNLFAVLPNDSLLHICQLPFHRCSGHFQLGTKIEGIAGFKLGGEFGEDFVFVGLRGELLRKLVGAQ